MRQRNKIIKNQADYKSHVQPLNGASSPIKCDELIFLYCDLNRTSNTIRNFYFVLPVAFLVAGSFLVISYFSVIIFYFRFIFTALVFINFRSCY